MAALLTPSGRAIGKMLCQNLGSVRAPVHGNIGRGMARGPQLDLELQDNPRLTTFFS